MKSILLVAIGVAAASAILGSLAISAFTPADDMSSQIVLEEKCEKIAAQGFKIQLKYSEIDFDKMPKEDADALKYLDDLWMKDCVSQMSPEKIVGIAQKVEREYYAGE